MEHPFCFSSLLEVSFRSRIFMGSCMLFLCISCGGGEKWQGGTVAYFQNGENRLAPAYRLFHASPDSSVLHFRVAHEELLYTRSSARAPFRAKLKVVAKVKGEEDQVLKIDSTFISDEGKGGGYSYGSLPLVWEKAKKKGWIELLFRDVKRGRSDRERLYFDREGKNAPQNFLPVQPEKGTPYFRSHFSKAERIGIRYERADPERIHGRVYSRDFPLPPPPFAENGFRSFDFTADSLFEASQDAAHYFELAVPGKGFIHLQVDTSEGRRGFTYYHFREGYPSVNTVDAMLGPIRYLTSEEEFAELKEMEDKKAAVDSFWVARGGSKERARELIKAYYKRVESANRYFTSHVEGWKTDRGLVHLIFGEPGKIERTSFGEKWVYDEGNDIKSLTFDFHRVKNPFSRGDMSLEREPIYKQAWYRAVETWRNGRIYSH